MVFRRKLHAYFAAIRSAADLKQREFIALRKLTIQLELKVDGACVVFARKRDSWDNVLIRAALGLADDFEQGSPGPTTPPPPVTSLTPTGLTPMDALTRIRQRNHGDMSGSDQPYNQHSDSTN